MSSPQAFRALRDAGRELRRPATHLAVADHAVPTRRRDAIADPLARAQVAELVDLDTERITEGRNTAILNTRDADIANLL